MDRKKALITAGAVSGTLFAASTAFALSGGLLDLDAQDGAGTLEPVASLSGQPAVPAPTSAEVAPATVAPPAPAPAVVVPEGPPVTRSEASASVRGDDDEEEEEEDEAGEGEEREDSEDHEEHEYEGADDDD